MVKSPIMSKSGFTTTLVVCFIAATNLSVYGIVRGGAVEAEELEIGEGGVGAVGVVGSVEGPGPFGHMSGFSADVLCREIFLRGVGGCYGAGGGPGLRPGGPFAARRRPISRRNHLRHGPEGLGPLGLGPAAGAVGGVGAIGGVEKSSSSVGAVDSENRLRDHNGIEGAQGSLVAANKKFDVGNHNNIHTDSSGLHKHQVVDNERLVVKENNRGVNDLDVGRTSKDLSTGSHLSSESGTLAAQGSRGSVENDRSVSNRNSAAAGQSNEFAAAGGVGAAGAAGAAGII